MFSNSTPVRIILSYPIDKIWEVLDGSTKYINIVYEDNVAVLTHYKQVIYNRYIWTLFESYPNCVISHRLSVTDVLNGEYYNADTHNQLFERIVKDICEQYNFRAYEDKSHLMRIVYQVFNLVYNSLVHNIGEFVTTIDAVDFIEVVEDPKIVEIHANLKANPVSIEAAYKAIGHTLNTSHMTDNMFVHAYRSKSINENQANQCIGPRGFVTDIERTVYKKPIMSGFIRGLNSIYELAAESRSAAKALNASDNHIKVSEYISRRLQLMAMNVSTIVHTDCGSTEYFDFLVKGNDLMLLKGKYYLDTDNILKDIKGNEEHLKNTTIKLRSIIHCTLHNPQEVCSTCFGRLSENFPSNSNIGHITTTYLMEKTTQSLLSTKHLTSSVKDSKIQLYSPTSDYFHVRDSDKIYVNTSIDLSKFSIVLSPSSMPKLLDVLSLSHTNISTIKIGEINSLGILYTANKKQSMLAVNVNYQDRAAIITHELLCYLKANKMYTDSKGNYVVDMINWDLKSPLLVIPLKESSLIKFVNKLASVIETDYEKITNPSLKLDTLYNLVNSKMKINIAVLEVLIYASTVYDRLKGDYSLGRNSPDPRTGKQMQVFSGRSLSQLYVFETQYKEIFNTNGHTFNPNNRSNFSMDIFFDPKNVINN